MRIAFPGAPKVLALGSVVLFVLAAVSPSGAQTGLVLNGSNQYVTFGVAPDLGASQFTLELWFRRDGAGVTTSTGTGGVTAVPLITKGRGEADGSNKDMNYFLGVSAANVLVADFEEGTGQTSPGLNHPVTGVTAIASGVWYHVAVTFDGSWWRLYLNGVLDVELLVGTGRLPQSASIQHAGLGSALTSAGAAAGFLNGVIDEARIWNRARSQAAIADSMFLEIADAPGLLGRWGLNEGSGAVAANSVAGGSAGTLISAPTWGVGSPFEIHNALRLGASNAYVTFGDPGALDLAQFTLEAWFRRDGAGTAVSTGSGGVTAVPLVTKGAAEIDGDNRDMNYFLGIRGSDNVLVADFEEGAGGSGPQGLNHPVAGITPIVTGTWYHAAATYDGTTWKLYLNGNPEAELVVGQPVQAASIQHAGLGTTLNSGGAASGYFNGALDEVRIWSGARTAEEIEATINQRLTASTPNLVARWGLDEWKGTTIYGTAGTAVNGTVTGSGWSWAGPAPFNAVVAPPTPPAAPGDPTLAADTHAQIRITWTDNSDNEIEFQLERSVDGFAGTYTLLAALAPNTTSYLDWNLTAGAEYCYRVRASNNAGDSDYTYPVCASTPLDPEAALSFGGIDSRVAFGDPAALDLAQFTLEAWVRRDGAGVTANTGSGGVLAVPLVTKGVGEADGDTRDMNYFLGIRGTDNVLVADFEEGTGGGTKGLNHPIAGHTAIGIGVWHHVAATYDGAVWRLYLDGSVEDTLYVGQPVESASIQHAGLASALNSSGTASGFFHGALDEVRIWNHARTLGEIRGSINARLESPETGLVARWSLDEGWGTMVGGSAGTAVDGTVGGSNYLWTAKAPFNVVFNDPPSAPVLVSPGDQAVDVLLDPTLEVTVADPEADALDVTFYGRPAGTGTPGADFTLIMLPDTQYYTAETNGATRALLRAQADWAIAQRTARNIAFVAHVGDLTDAASIVQMENADWALGVLEDPLLTGLAQGMPFDVSVGNHDQLPNGDPTGASTANFEMYFGASRFSGRDYYGGHYGTNNDNHWSMFSASGIDFLLVSLEYDTAPDAPVLAWADSLLAAHSGRKAIVVSHSLVGTGNPGSFSSQGQAVYDALKDQPNLFLMLCGHAPGEGRRTDVWNGSTVHTMLADFQSLTNGGNGWLRILEFSPVANELRVMTYSPVLDQWDTDATSQFTLPVVLEPTADWELLGTATGVPSGGSASLSWPGRAPSTEYEWRVTMSDGRSTVTGPTWRFTTGTGVDLIPPTVSLLVPDGGDTLTIGETAHIAWSASDNVGVTGVDLLLSRTGPAGPYETVALGLADDGSHDWLVTAPASAEAFLRIVVRDGADNSAADTSAAANWIRTGPTGIGSELPTALALLGAEPNPLRGSGRVAFALPAETRVRLSVVDVAGREVAVLAEGVYPAGVHRAPLLAGAAERIGSGVYFLRLATPGSVLVKKVAMLR